MDMYTDSCGHHGCEADVFILFSGVHSKDALNTCTDVFCDFLERSGAWTPKNWRYIDIRIEPLCNKPSDDEIYVVLL